MKAPDLAVVDDAGVHPWSGATDALKAAAAHAHLKFAVADLGHAKDRATLFAELDRALKLPEHFGHNFDALADVLEDRDWLGKSGRVIVLVARRRLSQGASRRLGDARGPARRSRRVLEGAARGVLDLRRLTVRAWRRSARVTYKQPVSVLVLVYTRDRTCCCSSVPTIPTTGSR